MARRIPGLLPLIPALFLWAAGSWNPLFALDVPFFAALHSDNHMGYYPGRDIREFDWDEKYLFSFGIDGLQWRDFGFGLALASRPDFIRQQVLIDSLALSWRQNGFSLAGVTRPQGVGNDYFFQQRQVSDPSFNTFLYDQARFNGLEFSLSGHSFIYQAGVGGSVHNLAMGFLSASRDSERLRYGLRLDGSTRDAHWTLPSLMPSLAISYRGDNLDLRSDTAWKMVLPQANKPAHQEFFHVSEARLALTGWPEILLGARYLERDHAPRQSLGLDAALVFRSGQFSLSPAYHYKLVDAIQLHELDFLVEWNPLPQISLGAYVSHEIPDTRQTVFTLGLQSSLRLGF